MSATFANISWHSNITSAVALLKNKEFAVLRTNSVMLQAKGKIFGKISNVYMKFDRAGLFEVAVFLEISIDSAWREYDNVKSFLVGKYGVPIYEKEDGSVWQDAELTGGTEIVLSLSSDHSEVGIVYQSPVNSQKEQSKYLVQTAKNREVAKDLL